MLDRAVWQSDGLPVKRAAIITAVTIVALFGLVGLAHAPPFRTLLMRAACPLGGDVDATAAVREATRQRAIAERKGTTPAPARTVFGFSMGTDSRAEVDAWVKSHDAKCSEDRSKMVLDCELASLEFFGMAVPGTVFFRSDDKGRLVSMLVTVKADDAQASALAAKWNETLDSVLGPPQLARGEVTDAVLSQSWSEHRFSDFVTSVSRTNMGAAQRVNFEAQAI